MSATALTPENEALLQSLPEPRDMLRYLLKLNEIPRMSVSLGGDLGPVKQKIIEIVTPLGCTHDTDNEGNLVVRKAGSPGYEHLPTVGIQSHIDMVCSADEEHASFDFKTQTIKMFKEGDFLRAQGTTLGADDGIGVAAALSMFANPPVPHPPLEALFTVDEETTMGGAENLAPAPFLQSQYMINVDSEEEYAICIGCAGGFETFVNLPIETLSAEQLAQKGFDAVHQVTLSGFLGGHTGVDIHRGRGNAIKLLARVLRENVNAAEWLLTDISCTSAMNTIPRLATATIALRQSDVERVEQAFQTSLAKLALEHAGGLGESPVLQAKKSLTSAESSRVLSAKSTQALLHLINVVPHGILRMNPDIPNEVESSVSFSRVSLPSDSQSVQLEFFARSSSQVQLDLTYDLLKSVAHLSGAQVGGVLNHFPSWKPNVKSLALEVVEQKSKELFQRDPRVYSVHAGLECGFLLGKYPSLDCVSIGPLIEEAHTPHERLYLPSVARFDLLLRETISTLAQRLLALHPPAQQ